MKTKFLEPKSDKILKFFNKPIEIQYHTLNFLRFYKLPIHIACKPGCKICQINSKIQSNKEYILNYVGYKFNKRPYPDKKTEFVVLATELITNHDTMSEDFEYYYLRLKPRQLLTIVDYFLANNIENVCTTEDDTLFNIKTGDYGNILEIKPLKYKKWLMYNAEKYLQVLDRLSSINIYQDLNMLVDDTDIDAVVHIYGTLVKEAILSVKGGQ